MLVFEKFGHIFKIRNDDWKNIRRRFNPDNAIYHKRARLYLIDIKCSLCEKYRYPRAGTCSKSCPFRKFEKSKYGCTEFLCLILGGEFTFGLSIDSLAWYSNVQTREQLKVLNNFMDK